MKYYLTFLFGTILALKSYSQDFYLGMSEMQVRKNVHAEIHSQRNEDMGETFLIWMDETNINTLKTITLRLKNNIVVTTMYEMWGGPSTLKAQIDYFNKNYIKITDSNWKAYSAGVIYNIVYVGTQKSTIKDSEEANDVFIITVSNQ